ncbi:unnamed protein product [Onchocerca flexuosa]|uniref:Uncharacterized protein n=1 Tax=Onchocerca flexuosa TaxID=387005 RepID=A0A183I6F3_9BILA|nr:unnamed protein product [Onchocerca flexuosa]
MNGASDENIENRIGEENEENEQFLRQKVQRKRRPHALAYRDTNISGAISKECELLQERSIYVSISGKSLLEKRRKHEICQQRYQEPPTKNRWLPTGTSAFTVFCDDDNDQGSSKDFKVS